MKQSEELSEKWLKKDVKLSMIGLVGSTQVRNSETLSDTEKKNDLLPLVR